MKILEGGGYSVILLEENKFLAQPVPLHLGEYEGCAGQQPVYIPEGNV